MSAISQVRTSPGLRDASPQRDSREALPSAAERSAKGIPRAPSQGKIAEVALGAALLLAGCATPEPLPLPVLIAATPSLEAEYARYSQPGLSALTGQAFFAQQGGGVAKAAGRRVSLDPATTIAADWWEKAGRLWAFRQVVPRSAAFAQHRRMTTADAEGRFTFSQLPAGEYFVRVEHTWGGGAYLPMQGGIMGRRVAVQPNQSADVILSEFAR